jgi:hypothetical protein
MRQRGKAKTKGRSPGLHEEHHCQRQGRRGRLIWQSRSQQIVIFLGLGLIAPIDRLRPVHTLEQLQRLNGMFFATLEILL